MLPNTNIRSNIFLFLLDISLFTATGIVLHKCEATTVIRLCPGLWETMALILIIKCLRVTLCAVAFKLMRGESRAKAINPLDLVIYTVFFVTECVTTSRALNTE